MEKHTDPVKAKPAEGKIISVQNLVGPEIRLPESKYLYSEIHIQRALKAQELCRQCRGKKCIQPTPGYMPLVVYYAGTVREAMHPCPYENIQKREWRKQHLLDQAGLPEMFRSSTFAEYQVDEGNRKAVETIRKMAADPQENRGFYLHGPSGVGKTMLAALYAKEKILQGKAVRFMTTAGLLNQLRRNITGDWNQRMDRYQEVPCLILDDLGTEFNSSFFLTNLYSLLNNRLGAKLPTIVTTNITDGALLEKLYTEKISSRLAAFVQIQFLGSDIRVQKAAE